MVQCFEGCASGVAVNGCSGVCVVVCIWVKKLCCFWMSQCVLCVLLVWPAFLVFNALYMSFGVGVILQGLAWDVSVC